jgi:hypothetical protein
MSQPEPVAGLLLDEANPRFLQGVSGQDEAITELLRQYSQKIISLAKDIVEQGAVNPTETVMAIEANGALVVIEGNRRVAALKLLRDPELARPASTELGQDLVKEFRDLGKVGTGPDTIEVWVAESREHARHWIELRHTGENGGVGVVVWDSLQANNFKRRPGTQADRADVFCKAIELEFPQEVELLRDIATVRRTRLTTLGRLIGDPRVRAQFGFDFDDDSVLFDFPSDALLPGIRRIFADLATGDVTVTGIKTKDHRRDFVKDRADALPRQDVRLPKPRLAGEDTDGSGARDATQDRSAATAADSRRAREPRRERVVFEGLRLHNVTDRIRGLLKQAQSIDIDGAPQVAGILVRILIELTVTDCIEHGVVTGKDGDNLKTKIRNALLALDPKCENPNKRNKDYTMAWTRTQDPDGMAVQSLHAFVHNRYGAATASEVRDYSAGFRPMMEHLDALIGAKQP